MRWHRREDVFCLPYETRQLVESENVEDEALRLDVLDEFSSRADTYCRANALNYSCDDLAQSANATVERIFEAQGLELATFLSEEKPQVHSLTVSDHLDTVLAACKLPTDATIRVKPAVLEVLRGAFYQSSEIERTYFGKLCRTYTLFLALKTEPRIVEYFRSMSTRLVLYVGSDLLVLALSEYFLPVQDQMVSNMLRVVREAGATLILSEPVLEEVLGQFRASMANTELCSRTSSHI